MSEQSFRHLSQFHSSRNLGGIQSCTYDGKLCYYKGVGSLRALFKECELSEEAITPYFCANLQEATARYREALQQNPFAENVPVLVENLRLAVQGKQLCVQDANNELIPVQMQDITRTDILSVTGGKPFCRRQLLGAKFNVVSI